MGSPASTVYKRNLSVVIIANDEVNYDEDTFEIFENDQEFNLKILKQSDK